MESYALDLLMIWLAYFPKITAGLRPGRTNSGALGVTTPSPNRAETDTHERSSGAIAASIFHTYGVVAGRTGIFQLGQRIVARSSTSCPEFCVARSPWA